MSWVIAVIAIVVLGVAAVWFFAPTLKLFGRQDFEPAPRSTRASSTPTCCGSSSRLAARVPARCQPWSAPGWSQLHGLSSGPVDPTGGQEAFGDRCIRRRLDHHPSRGAARTAMAESPGHGRGRHGHRAGGPAATRLTVHLLPRPPARPASVEPTHRVGRQPGAPGDACWGPLRRMAVPRPGRERFGVPPRLPQLRVRDRAHRRRLRHR